MLYLVPLSLHSFYMCGFVSCMGLVFRILKLGLQRILWYLLRMGSCSKYYGEYVIYVFTGNSLTRYSIGCTHDFTVY
jgi:hypothetical protein